MVGAWFLLKRGGRTEEVAQGNKNQNILLSNIGSANNSSVANAAPETAPSPEVASPIESAPNAETLYAINDGRLTVDDKGNVKGAENLSPAAQNAIKQSLQSGKLSVANHSLGGGVVLMSGGDAGKGIPFGLSWSLMVAGARNVVVSQWKVESASTTDSTIDFYKSLKQTVSKKPESLRQAALKLRRNPSTAHPFYWAGFVLIGEAE